MENKPWYDNLIPDEERILREAIEKVKALLGQGKTFDEAIIAIEIHDPALRESIVDDTIKVLIAEEHFAGLVSIEALAKKLRVDVARLNKARTEMLQDVEEAAIEAYKATLKEQGPHGNA